MNKARDQHFQRFEPHTLLKHLVLRSYLQAWAMKLLIEPKRTVWFVDAFAGEGRDAQGNPGSPLIAAKIARQVLAVKGARQGRAPMTVLAIDNDRKRCKRLEQVLSEYMNSMPPLVHLRCTTLEQRIDRFLRHVAADPVLFFLDPFGLKGIVLETLRKALAGPRNEIFALFSDMGAVRLQATLFTEGRDLDVELAQLAGTPSLFPEFDVDEIAGLVGERFAGEEVPWTAGRDRGGAVSVKRFLLSETPVFRWQLERVKEKIDRFRQPGRTIRYRFP